MPAGDHALQVFGGLGIDLRGIGIDPRRQVDFGLGDVQEGPGLAGSALARFSLDSTS